MCATCFDLYLAHPHTLIRLGTCVLQLEVSANNRHSAATLNSILSPNLQTEFKEGFCKRIRYIAAMPCHAMLWPCCVTLCCGHAMSHYVAAMPCHAMLWPCCVTLCCGHAMSHCCSHAVSRYVVAMPCHAMLWPCCVTLCCGHAMSHCCGHAVSRYVAAMPCQFIYTKS